MKKEAEQLAFNIKKYGFIDFIQIEKEKGLDIDKEDMRNNPLELNNDHDQISLDSKDSKDKEV